MTTPSICPNSIFSTEFYTIVITITQNYQLKKKDTKTIILPLGETLFFGGDAYLAFWGVDHPDPVTVKSKPLAAKAFVFGQGNDARLTPDIAGPWLLKRGLQEVVVQVKANFLNEDTFLNYNYSPVSPLAVGQMMLTSIYGKSLGAGMAMFARSSGSTRALMETSYSLTGLLAAGIWGDYMDYHDGDYALIPIGTGIGLWHGAVIGGYLEEKGTINSRQQVGMMLSSIGLAGLSFKK